jgi:CHAT domain-containing protein/tetratricopeptide (TPR) repeat protein
MTPDHAQRPNSNSAPHQPLIWRKIVPWLLGVMLGLPLVGHSQDARGPEAALAEAEHAVRVSEQERGPDNPETATQLNRLAIFYREAGQYNEALPLFERALAIRERTLGPADAATLKSIEGLAMLYLKLGQPAKAAPLYDRALSLAEMVSATNHEDLIETLNGLAFAENELGQYAKALPLYERALSLRQSSLGADDPDTVTSLNDVAFTYSMLGQYEKALPLYERALAIRERLLGAEHPTVGESLNGLGMTLSRLGQFDRALPVLQRAIVIQEKSHPADDPDNAWTLTHLAHVYWELGRYADAMQIDARALAIREKSLGPWHPDTATSLNGLAASYVELGQYAQALPLNERALAIREQIQGPDHPDTATSLGALAYAYHRQGDDAKGLPLLVRTLEINEKILGPEHPYTATLLHNLAYTYSELRQYDKAMPLDERALRIQEKIFGVGSSKTARTLVGLARTHLRLGDRTLALLFLRRAEIAAFSDESRLAVGQASYELARYYSLVGKRELAIFHGKQAVNAMQSIRIANATLARELQRSLLEANKGIYQQLADWLITAGRLAEAQQVLAMLKQDEYFEFIQRDAVEDTRTLATYTGREPEWARRYDEISGQLAALGKELGGLRVIKAKGGMDAEQEKRVTQLEADMATASQAFDAMVATMVQDLGSQQAQDITREKIDTFSALREVLGELGEGVVLLHYVPLPERTRIILTTRDVQLAREVNIGEEGLNQKIAKLREVLQDRRRDPRPLAQEVYGLLLAPVADDLEQAGAKTVMLSLNGSLRYLPFAALYDGKHYLAERFALALYTDAATANLKERAPAQVRVWGLGLTKATPGFNALPNVRQELEGIIGAVPGQAFMDAAFTAAKLHEGLERAYPVLHIASHFVFTPGTEQDSYLVLGDGSHLTLAQVRHEYRFSGVDLLTLSACDSGFGGGRTSDGREVEGLGALAQKRGAHGVLAALWPVADESTAQLMPEMYRLREENKLSKAEALRRAQVEFIGGRPSTDKPGSRRATKRAIAQPEPPFAHPYFWAPFILMGNWL